MEKPKEIEERMMQDLVANHMKIRQWIKRLLVISVAAVSFSVIAGIRAVFYGNLELALVYLMLGLFNFLNAQSAYRRVI